MFGLLALFIEFRLVRGSFAACFFENAGNGPDAAGLFFEAAETGFAAGHYTEIVLLGDGLPELLRLCRRDFAVGAQDEADTGPFKRISSILGSAWTS